MPHPTKVCPKCGEATTSLVTHDKKHHGARERRVRPGVRAHVAKLQGYRISRALSFKGGRKV